MVGDATGIIVNYQTPYLTIAAATSLLDAGVSEVVVVDNDSADQSVEAIESALGSIVTVIRNDRNLGFGAGANRGAAAATSSFLLFLNSDATVRPGAVDLLVRRLRESPVVGIVAPRVVLPDGRDQPDAYGTFPTLSTIVLRSNRNPSPETKPDWVSGVALAVRREEFLRLRGFDERIHMYFEDVMLCRTYRLAGLGVERLVDSVVVHVRGGSWEHDLRRRRAYDDALLRYFELTGTRRPLLVALRAGLWLGSRLGLRATTPA